MSGALMRVSTICLVSVWTFASVIAIRAIGQMIMGPHYNMEIAEPKKLQNSFEICYIIFHHSTVNRGTSWRDIMEALTLAAITYWILGTLALLFIESILYWVGK